MYYTTNQLFGSEIQLWMDEQMLCPMTCQSQVGHTQKRKPCFIVHFALNGTIFYKMTNILWSRHLLAKRNNVGQRQCTGLTFQEVPSTIFGLHFLLLPLSTAVHCLPSVVVLLLDSPNWGCLDRHLL